MELRNIHINTFKELIEFISLPVDFETIEIKYPSKEGAAYFVSFLSTWTWDEIDNVLFDAVVQKSTSNYQCPKTDSDEEYEPYFGWCNVEGCENEGANGGCCWRETGYWTVCCKHASEYRAGKPQPKMQQKYIDKEATRLPDGTLPIVNEG